MNSEKVPTHVRYHVVLVTTLMSFVLYLHRYFLSFIERFIKQDFGLSDTEIGLLLSVFFWAYGLGQVPGGWLSDRFGARRMLTAYIVLWSVLTGLVGVGTSFVMILLLRFGCGLAQAGAYPTSAGILSKWSPFPVRGIASSVVATGGRIGGVAAPMLTAYLLISFVSVDVSSLLKPGDIVDTGGLCERLNDQSGVLSGRLLASFPPQTTARVGRGDATEEELRNALNGVLKQRDFYQQVANADVKLEREAVKLAKIPPESRSQAQVERLNRLLIEAVYPDPIKKVYGSGWRAVIFVYCGIGIAIGVLFWLIVRDRPDVHPRANEGEVALIEGSRPANAPSPHGQVNKLPWGRILSNRSLWCSSLSQFATVFGHIFIVTWFARFLADVHHVPVMERAWMISLPMLAGMAGMMLGGWWTDWFTRRFGLRKGRSWPLAIARFVGMAAFAACVVFDSRWGVTISLTVMAFATDLGVPAVWAYNQDVGGRLAGSVLGWGNMWGCLAAAASPIVLNLVIELGSWDAMFLCCSASLFIAGLAALGVDATSSVAPSDKP